MINRNNNGYPPRDRWDDTWDGQERRQVVYVDNNHQNPEPPSKSTNWMPYIGQAITLIAGLVTIYVNLHEEQLKLNIQMSSFLERYKEDTDRHNKTHTDIYQKVDVINQQTQSLEETVQSLYNRRIK